MIAVRNKLKARPAGLDYSRLALDWMQQRGNTPREALFPLLFPLRAGQAEPTMEER